MADKHVTASGGTTDRSVVDHIRELVAEEQRLHRHREPTEATAAAGE